MAMTGSGHSSTMIIRPRLPQEHLVVVHLKVPEPLVLVLVRRRVAQAGHLVMVRPMVAEALPRVSRVLEP